MRWRVVMVAAMGSLVVAILLMAAVVVLRVSNRSLSASDLPWGFSAGYDAGRLFIRHESLMNTPTPDFKTPPGGDVKFSVALLAMLKWTEDNSAHWDRMGIAWHHEFQLLTYVMGAWQVDEMRTLSVRFEYLVLGSMLLGWISWLIWTRSRRRLLRSRRGLCQTCGYDLRASQDRCPECGTSFVESG